MYIVTKFCNLPSPQVLFNYSSCFVLQYGSAILSKTTTSSYFIFITKNIAFADTARKSAND